MSVEISRLRAIAAGGDAIGEVGGKTAFVPLGIPGELVRLQVSREYPRYVAAELTEILEPSPDRVAAPCPYFGRCGGCQWQHIRYARQLELKRQIVADAMARIGKLPNAEVLPVLGMNEPWGCRNNVQFEVLPSGMLAFKAFHSHAAVEIDRCLITQPVLNELAVVLRPLPEGIQRAVLRCGVNSGERLILLEGYRPPKSVAADVECVYRNPKGALQALSGKGVLHEQLGGRRWQVSAGSFFQVNTAQAEVLLAEVRKRLPEGGDLLVDAYCGVGTFALSLAERFERVVGIESAPSAIEDAMVNGAGDPHVRFRRGTTESELSGALEPGCTMICDPPRAGCGPAVLRAMAEAEVGMIVYVSCDPATLARDLATLASLGYAVGALQPVDMFPQTAHIECVVALSRNRI
ncbi:MAG: class I SAM-dependent RNA methyltransferase [Chloroflexi bacterium]|nr:class I SAM-dependent RNA methyltransferase [Chloroflexota bacterium]